MAMPIQFKLPYAALQSYKSLISVIDKTGSIGSTFDLMITPTKGENGAPDSLVMEVSKDKAYGIVQIPNVEVIEGAGVPFLLSTSIFDALPETTSDSPIEFTIDEKLFIAYPNTSELEDLKFDFEYSDNPSLFMRKPVVPHQYTFSKENWKKLAEYISAASEYTIKKEEADSMSTVKLTLDPSGLAIIEATNGTDAFVAEVKLDMVGTDTFTCLLHPPAWTAALLMGKGGEVYVGMDDSNISFTSNGMVMTHVIMNYPNFPTVMNVIKDHIQKPCEVFSGTIAPAPLHSKLKYLESAGMTAKAWEPLFIVSNQGGVPMVKLKGYQSNGQAKIADKAILDIKWSKDKEVRIPARLMLRSLNVCEELGLNQFYDIEGLPAVFFSNPEKSCFILLAQEVSEG